MHGITDEQMYRPLFEAPTAAIERPDEWSEPLGFLVGGGANQPFQHLGQQCYDAAWHLVEAVKHQDVADHRVANPIMYLYRHSIELFLKSILQGAARTHSLDTLSDEYRSYIKEKFGSDVPEWLIQRMKELGAIDPNSTAFRYNMVYDTPVDGEFHVNLHHLQSSMTALNVALVGTLAMVACEEG